MKTNSEENSKIFLLSHLQCPWCWNAVIYRIDSFRLLAAFPSFFNNKSSRRHHELVHISPSRCKLLLHFWCFPAAISIQHSTRQLQENSKSSPLWRLSEHFATSELSRIKVGKMFVFRISAAGNDEVRLFIQSIFSFFLLKIQCTGFENFMQRAWKLNEHQQHRRLCNCEQWKVKFALNNAVWWDYMNYKESDSRAHCCYAIFCLCAFLRCKIRRLRCKAGKAQRRERDRDPLKGRIEHEENSFVERRLPSSTMIRISNDHKMMVFFLFYPFFLFFVRFAADAVEQEESSIWDELGEWNWLNEMHCIRCEEKSWTLTENRIGFVKKTKVWWKNGKL